MVTAIVTSDNHLGAYYARLRPERLERRRGALRAAFARVVDAAIERRADLFLHAGDLFDRPDPRNAERSFVARQIRRLLDAEIRVFAIAGNHDSPRSWGYDGGALPQEEMDALGAIRLLRDTATLQAETCRVRGLQVGIRGMSSDFNRPPGACPLEGCDGGERGGDVDLALLHYGFEGGSPPYLEEPCLSLAGLDRLGADVICAGHLHARTQRRLPGGALLLNPGATEHIRFGDEHLKCGFWMLRLAPGEAHAEYLPLPTQPMRTLELSVEDLLSFTGSSEEAMDDDPLLGILLRQIEAASDPEQLLRVRLAGRLPRARARALDLAALQSRANAANFHCQLDTERLICVDEIGDLPLGYGVSFDVAEEMQNTVRALVGAFGDDPRQQEISRLAGRELVSAYERLTRRSR